MKASFTALNSIAAVTVVERAFRAGAEAAGASEERTTDLLHSSEKAIDIAVEFGKLLEQQGNILDHFVNGKVPSKAEAALESFALVIGGMKAKGNTTPQGGAPTAPGGIKPIPLTDTLTHEDYSQPGQVKEERMMSFAIPKGMSREETEKYAIEQARRKYGANIEVIGFEHDVAFNPEEKKLFDRTVGQ